MNGTKWAALLGGLMLLAGILWWVLRPTPAPNTATNRAPSASDTEAADRQAAPQLPAGANQEGYQRAQRMFANLYPGQTPTELDLYSLAGELALSEDRLTDALPWFAAIPTNHPRYGLAARSQEASALIELDRLQEAEASLLDFWKGASRSQNVDVRRVLDVIKRLDYVLSVEIRLEDRAAFLKQVHQLGLADVLDSKHLLLPHLLLLNSNAGRNKIAAALKVAPDNVVLQTAQARYDTMAGEFDAATQRLTKLRESHPDNRRVLAALLEAYFEAGEMEAFAQLAEQAPPVTPDEPWLLTRLRGEFALSQQQYQPAIQHFEKVLSEEPAHLPCQMSLARALAGDGQSEAEQQALQRAQALSKIRVQLNQVRSDSGQALRELVDLCRTADLEAAVSIFQMHADALQKQSGTGVAPASPVPAASSSK